MPNQARLSPTWKEEVNQRIAAHKRNKPVPVAEQDTLNQAHHAANKRAAAAAARVAERFAKAPRYSELLENEARAAVRAAEAVSRAALQAQAVAESVLAELEAAKAAQPEWQFHDDEEPVVAQHRDAVVEEVHREPEVAPLEPEHEDRVQSSFERTSFERQSYEIRWEPDMPVRQTDPVATSKRNEVDEWQEHVRPAEEPVVEVIEPAQPIHANLIEFPREIVATRKVRPRRAEGPFAAHAEQGAQLSIFEVDPEAISTDPATVEAMNPAAAPTWMGPEWSGMELDEHPEDGVVEDSGAELLEEPIPAPIVIAGVEQAPLTLRLMAAVVDGSLVLASFLGATVAMMGHAHSLPGLREAEMGAAAGLMIVSALYTALFYAIGEGTPGMRYARISLCTFEGKDATREQRLRRFAALLLSVLPVGLGVMWAIFDDNHLSWHDRLSGTYLRSN